MSIVPIYSRRKAPGVYSDGWFDTEHQSISRAIAAVSASAFSSATSLATFGQYPNFSTGIGVQVFADIQPTAQSNTLFGYQNGMALRTAQGCTFIGTTSGISCIDGDYNTGVGVDALYFTRHGYANWGGGADAGGFNVDGHENSWTGFNSGFSNTFGNNNTGNGFKSLWTNLTGSRLIGLGNFAGYYATGDDELFINNQDRLNLAGDRSLSIISGTMAALASDQRLRFNAKVGIGGAATSTSQLNITGLPVVAAGLVTGDVWNNAGVLTIA